MAKRHLKRLAAPRNWPIKRKGIKFIARPLPGPHRLNRCVTINLLLKNLLKYAKTTREVKRILNNKKILIDKKVRNDHRFPLGLFDVIEIPDTDEHYTLLLNKKGKFALVKIKKDLANSKFCKIIKKTVLKGNKVQLNLYDGKNIIVGKDGFKVGDSIILNLSKNNVEKHLKFEKGAHVYIANGKYVGNFATVEGIKTFQGAQPAIVKLKMNKASFETLKDYVFIIDNSLYNKNERDKD